MNVKAAENPKCSGFHSLFPRRNDFLIKILSQYRCRWAFFREKFPMEMKATKFRFARLRSLFRLFFGIKFCEIEICVGFELILIKTLQSQIYRSDNTSKMIISKMQNFTRKKKDKTNVKAVADHFFRYAFLVSFAIENASGIY
jgi:hypothetical protein